MKWQFGIVAALAMALGACASVKNPVQATQVYELENAYGVAQAGAIAYVKLPRCPMAAPLCSKAANVVAIGEADKKARIALNAVESFARNPANYPTLSFGALIAAAQSAISAFQALSK